MSDAGTDGDSEQERLTDREQERWRELHEVPFDDLSDAEITSKIKLSVKRRFSFPEWVLLFEYGAPNGRVADCLAVNTMPSRNYKVVGFEFKASRSDWLRELKDGQKADYFVRLADEWYVVAPKGVIEESEIPDGWGYLELKPNSEKLYKLQDSELTAHQRGDPDRRFWVKFVKKTVGSESNYSKADLEEARSRGYEEAKNEIRKKRHVDLDIDRLQRKANNWDDLQDRFEALPFHRLDDEKLRTIELGYRLVRMVERDGITGIRGEIDSLRNSVERYTGRIEDDLEDLANGLDILEERIEDGNVPPPEGHWPAEESGGDA